MKLFAYVLAIAAASVAVIAAPAPAAGVAEAQLEARAPEPVGKSSNTPSLMPYTDFFYSWEEMVPYPWPALLDTPSSPAATPVMETPGVQAMAGIVAG